MLLRARLTPGKIELAVGQPKWEGKSAVTLRLSNLLRGNQQTLLTAEVQPAGSVRYSEIKGLDYSHTTSASLHADAAEEPRPAHFPVE